MTHLHGRSLIVTGGASGIGRAAVLAAAKAGARVTIADRDAAGAEAVCAEAKALGGEAQAVPTDVSEEAEVVRLVAAAVSAYGRLDAAFNNAAISSVNIPLTDLPLELYERTQAINLRSVFLCMKHEITAMLQTGGGAIVNTASTAAIHAIPHSGEYAAAKAGVLGMTRAAAFDFARQGVRVNAILPGATRTPMVMTAAARHPGVVAHLEQLTPLGRLLEPEEVAAAALWLLSDGASAVTGVCLPVDGGLTIP